MPRKIEILDQVRYRVPMEVDVTKPHEAYLQGRGIVTNISDDLMMIEIDNHLWCFNHELGLLEN